MREIMKLDSAKYLAECEADGAWWRGVQLPYLMPHVWYAMLAAAFGIGGIVGVGLALWTLSVRGLL